MTDHDEFDPRWDGVFYAANDWKFHRELLERYGIVLRPGDYQKILTTIRDGKATAIPNGPGGTIYTFRLAWWPEEQTPRLYVGCRLYRTGARLTTAWKPSRDLNLRRKQVVEAAERRVCDTVGVAA